MGLNVTLENTPEEHTCWTCNGKGVVIEHNDLFSSNITHNLTAMAREAGIYMHLWRPEEIGITKAKQLIEPLRNGLALLKSNPVKFMALDAANGWGKYIHFVPWIEEYLEACESYPDANIKADR